MLKQTKSLFVKINYTSLFEKSFIVFVNICLLNLRFPEEPCQVKDQIGSWVSDSNITV